MPQPYGTPAPWPNGDGMLSELGPNAGIRMKAVMMLAGIFRSASRLIRGHQAYLGLHCPQTDHRISYRQSFHRYDRPDSNRSVDVSKAGSVAPMCVMHTPRVSLVPPRNDSNEEFSHDPPPTLCCGKIEIRAAATAWPPSGADRLPWGYLQAIACCRIGRNTTTAMNAAIMLRIAAITKTAVQLPVQVVSTLPSGTSSAAVPFAVYNKP